MKKTTKNKIFKWIKEHFFNIKYPSNNLIGFVFLIICITMMMAIRIFFHQKNLQQHLR